MPAVAWLSTMGLEDGDRAGYTWIHQEGRGVEGGSYVGGGESMLGLRAGEGRRGRRIACLLVLVLSVLFLAVSSALSWGGCWGFSFWRRVCYWWLKLAGAGRGRSEIVCWFHLGWDSKGNSDD